MKVWDVTGLVAAGQTNGELDKRLGEAAEVLRNGGLVSFPTETVYGLGANALNEDSVRGIFRAKGRPSDNPLIVHIADRSQLHLVVPPGFSPSPLLEKALDAFWPGPLTVIVPARDELAPSVHPGIDTVGLRCPNHPVASALLRLAGCPVAAPSANQSGKPSPTTASDVVEDMAGRIDGVVDGGPSEVGLESTVVDIGDDGVTIYRPGGITKEQLEAALGVPVESDAYLKSASDTPKSPGMKYRHYAPDAQVRGWWGDFEKVAKHMKDFVANHAGEKIAIISPRRLGYTDLEWNPNRSKALHRFEAPNGADPKHSETDETYAKALSHELFRLLREFDRLGAQHVLVCGVEPKGLGAALMNRLQKSTEGRLQQL